MNMKVLVPKQDLTRALALVNKIHSGARPHTDRLVRLKTDGSSLLLQAATGEVFLTLRVPTAKEIIQEGEACVSAPELLHFVKSNIDKYVELHANGEKLVVRVYHLTQKLELKPTELFPEFPEPQFQVQASLPSFVLAQGINKVSFAVAKKEEGPLAHLLIDGRGDHTRIVASDGYRLAVVKFDYPSDLNVRIYYKSFKILRELLKDTETVYIGSGDKFVHITNGEWVLSVRDYSSGSRYPLYDEVIWPDDAYELTVEVLADDLKNALENFKKYDKISVEFTDRQFLKISAQGREVYVRADILGNIGFSLDFSPQKLYDFVNAASCTSGYGAFIKAKFVNDDNVPAMFRLYDNYLYIVMPLVR